MISSLFQIVIGFSGIMGFALKYIGPLTICPTIALVGLPLFGTAGSFAGEIVYSTLFIIKSSFRRRLINLTECTLLISTKVSGT